MPSWSGGSVSTGPAEQTDRCSGALLLDHGQELGPVTARDVQVEQHDVNGLLREELGRDVEGARLEHVVPLELEVQAAEQAQRGVVLDHEDRRRDLSPGLVSVQLICICTLVSTTRRRRDE